MRPLSEKDLYAIAQELINTDESLEVAMGVLGIDPYLFDEGEVEKWLWQEYRLYQDPDTCQWRTK